MLNEVRLIGRLGKDPELRQTQTGTSVGSFSVATTDRIKKGEEWTDVTDWHNVVVWGNQAENAHKYLVKGSLVHIAGKLKTRKWQDKSGQDRYTTEVVASEVKYLSPKKAETAERESGQSTKSQSAAPQQNLMDDDIPF